MDKNEKDNPHQNNSFRTQLAALVTHQHFQFAIIAIIFLNGLIIVAETYLKGNALLLTLDKIIVWIFIVEMILKLVGLGVKRYFSSGWNLFDFSIVVASILFYSTPFVSILRLVRVMRLIRMIPAIPALRKIIDSLLKAVPALTGILGLTFLIFSIYAIIGTTFYHDVLPYEFFGSFHSSLFTLLQVVTFESWASQVARPVIQEIPAAWIYFVSFIIIGALVILNLVVAVILSYLNADEDAHRDEKLEQVLEENREVKKELAEIKQLLQNRS
ncbi:ion transporter [Alkalihalobacillus oceani]|uniref:Ion transporter n=1 Tax=Halalkalibacter oceani TaxID=1653776 RepID=A0A9X2DQN5_9BACI|nr:ion transporter [Halalkalibacter oceani]MCM3713353.1 ion transporter [Halalkalibacter oceani]